VTAQDAIDSLIMFLQSNLTSVGNGIIEPGSISDEGDTEARQYPTVITSYVATDFTEYVGGKTIEQLLIQLTISTDNKDHRNTLREDVFGTLRDNRNEIPNIPTLWMYGKRNLDTTLMEHSSLNQRAIYHAIVEIIIYDP
jgi:hypothetical protein